MNEITNTILIIGLIVATVFSIGAFLHTVYVGYRNGRYFKRLETSFYNRYTGIEIEHEVYHQDIIPRRSIVYIVHEYKDTISFTSYWVCDHWLWNKTNAELVEVIHKLAGGGKKRYGGVAKSVAELTELKLRFINSKDWILHKK